MKIAVFGDIHGNIIGLDTVLDDIDAQGGADGYWLLGDYALGGPDPVGVLERITKLENAVFIRGNVDRYLVEPDLPAPNEIPPERLGWLIRITRNQFWARGALSKGRWLDWIATLPIEYRVQLPNGVKILLVHCVPGRDSGPGLYPDQTDEEIREIFGKAEESLIFVGHTHILQDRKLDDKHIVNPGCIGKHLTSDTRASYVMLNADETSYEITHHYVDYDTELVIKQMFEVGYPGAPLMQQNYRGEYVYIPD